MATEKIPGHRGALCVERRSLGTEELSEYRVDLCVERRSLGSEKSWGYREIWGSRRELELHVSQAKFRNYFKKCCDNFSTYA